MIAQQLNALAPERAISIKKYGYLGVFLLSALIFSAPLLGRLAGNPDLYTLMPFMIIFVVIPILDGIVGLDTFNPDEADRVPSLKEETYYRWLTIATLPLQLAIIAFGLWYYSSGILSPWAQVSWIIATGLVTAAIGINVGHELVHKESRLEQWTGGLLLSTVCYAGFKVEHVRGHHVNVATPLDATSAKYNQSLFHFLPRAYWHNISAAFKLEAKRLANKGLPALHWRNELIWWYSISALFALVCYLGWGMDGLVFFLAQSFVAFTTLESINYVEHYGLSRKRLDNGRYERVTPHHSWNSSHMVSNLLLFQLQRHSDHHAFARRRYQVLRHHEDAPQLPSGYPAMLLLAWVPPLWFKVMNPRVDAYYDNPDSAVVRAES